MSYKETVKAILKKAVSKEKDSYLFYKDAANNSKDDHVKNALIRLARKEQRHIEAIKAIDIKRLKGQEVEIKETSRQWIAGYLTSTEEGLSKDSDFKDVFIYAAKREKNAFEFYNCMSKLVEDSKLKELFVWLAQEESKHEAELFYDLIYR